MKNRPTKNFKWHKISQNICAIRRMLLSLQRPFIARGQDILFNIALAIIRVREKSLEN